MILRGHLAGRTVTVLCAVTVAVFSFVPIVYLFVSGISLHDVREQFGYSATVAALWQTIELTAAISALTVLLGVGCALLVVRTTLPIPRLFTVLFALPLAVPGFVSAYADYSTELTYAPHLSLVTSFGGASLVMALTRTGYVFLPSVIALSTIDPGRKMWSPACGRPDHDALAGCPARRCPGDRGWSTHRRPARAGRIRRHGPTRPQHPDHQDHGRDARLPRLLLRPVAVAAAHRPVHRHIAATRILTGPSRTEHALRNNPSAPSHVARSSSPSAAVIGLVIPLTAVGPTVFMTIRGLTNSDRSGEVDWGQVGTSLSTTLVTRTLRRAVATAVALPVSWWVIRSPSISSTVAERAVWIAHAIPSAILALALVYLATRLVPSLYKIPTVLIAAYVILFLPLPSPTNA